MIRTLVLPALLAALGPWAGTSAAGPLTIGSPAPELKVGTWVKGDPVDGIRKGKVYVIEFWQTTCGPCIRCMPHLSDLQRRHKDVIFACLSAQPEKTVRDFVAKHDKDMSFRVGVDEQGRTWGAWMNAAGLEGVPWAFVVDATGKVAWIGNPAEIDEPLTQILAGKYNPQSAVVGLRFYKARQEAERKDDERLERGNRLAAQVEKLIEEKKAAEAVSLVDRAIQKEPGERVWYGQMKLQALVADPALADRALEHGIELAASASVWANTDQPVSQVLLHIASLLSRPSGDHRPDPRCCDLAIEIIKHAQDVARAEKGNSEQDQFDQRIRSDGHLAYAHAAKGAYDKAVAHAESALKAYRTATPPPSWAKDQILRQNMEAWAKGLEADLAEFKKEAGTPRK
jgi:thiol-disulfide isomerase/thioredoxin